MANDKETQAGSYDDMKAQLGMEVEKPTEPQEQPKEETPVEETPKAEESVVEETPQEPVAEGGGDEPTEKTPPVEGEAPKEEPKQTIFDINEVNKRFSTQFKDESELDAKLKSADRVADLEKQIAELESLKEENLLLKQGIDPMNYFTSEDEFKVQMFRKQFPDKDAPTAYALFTQDVSQMSDIDVLAYETMLDNPGIDKETVLEVINDKYGIEEGEELDKTSAAKIKIDANQARKGINQLKSEVKLPDKVDADAIVNQQKELMAERTQKLTEGWSAVAKELVNNLPDYVLKDEEGNELFKYSVKDFPQDRVEDMVNLMVNNGISLDRDAAQSMMDVMHKEYFYENRESILKSIREDALAKAEEERLQKQHNPGQPKQEAEPKKDEKKDGQEQLKSQIMNSGWQPKRIFG